MTSPSWISKAASAAAQLEAKTCRPSATHSVYLVLLHDPNREDGFGLYVGQTSLDPDLRFDQHKKGYKASRAAKRYGVRLLPELVEHLNPMGSWEALEIEAALAEALREVGVPWVEGGH
jgi:predicted GIY-YIG superfamily endonuclease